jgi:predicted nuclease of restriction endonuclease-like (RecB) superfamily
VRAVFAVNREIILLYWRTGRAILERQNRDGWGAKVIERLAADLHRDLPNTKGFSRTNLLYMRAFADAWPDELFVQQVVGQIGWGHNLRILDLVKDPEEREWYAGATLQHGWSRNVLAHQIESGLHRRQGKAQTNFPRTLPPPQSDLAQQVLKDPYNFDFPTLAENRYGFTVLELPDNARVPSCWTSDIQETTGARYQLQAEIFLVSSSPRSLGPSRSSGTRRAPL